MGCRICVSRASILRTCSQISQQKDQLKRTLISKQSCSSEPFTFAEFYRKIDYICKYHISPYSTLDLEPENLTVDLLYNEIRMDLTKKDKHLFRVLICCFSTMLIRLFQFTNWDKMNFEQDSYISFKNDSQSISYADRERLCSFECDEKIKTESTCTKVKGDFQKLIFAKLKSEQGLAQQILKTVDYIFALLRKVLLQTYHKAIVSVIKDDLIEREFLIQRAIQQFILHRTQPLYHIIVPAIQIYYSNQDFKQQAIEPNLSMSLMPVKENQFVGSEFRSFDTSGVMDSILEQIEEEDETPKGFNRKEVIYAIQRSESTLKVPYSKTFPIIRRILRTNKFWKKVFLIDKLDKMIIQIYLFQRTESEMMRLYDTISAEDSKAEILLYILYKFCQTLTKESQEKDLFLPLKFMCDFDGVLHKDVKYVYQQSFMRFYSILEMLLLSEIS